MNSEEYARKALTRARICEDREEWGKVFAYADEVLQHDHTCAQAYFLMGRAAYNSKLPALATQMFHICTKLAPEQPEPWNNLGVSLMERDEEGSYKAFRKAYELNQKMVPAMSSLCAVAHSLGRYDEALSWAELCLKQDPANKDVLYNSALSLLAMGKWEDAWPKYNVTLGIKERNVRNFHGDKPTPRWDGRSDCKVVIYGEQGIGDEIMFASMIPQAIASGAEVVLETDRRLAGLYRRSFPQAKVYPTRGQDICEWVADEKPDMRLEVGGLGEFYGKAPFWSEGYLKADPAKMAMAKAWLDHECAPNALRVGIAWTAGTWSTGKRKRSLPIETMGMLLQTPGIEWVCLEYDDPSDDLARIEALHGVKLHDPRSMVCRGADYDDTAALVSALDMVIAPTTSVVDLAGALGRPVWAMVPAHPQWRYGEAAGIERMFWYESAMTFRQKTAGDWSVPLMRATKRLHEMTRGKAAA